MIAADIGIMCLPPCARVDPEEVFTAERVLVCYVVKHPRLGIPDAVQLGTVLLLFGVNIVLKSLKCLFMFFSWRQVPQFDSLVKKK